MRVTAAAVLFLLASSLLAADLGRAEGSLTIDKTRFDLLYAYAVDRQKNELTNKSDLTKIVLTDKPLADSVNLAKIDETFPDGITGVIVYVDREQRVSRVVVEHPTGMFDAGFFEGIPDYRFRPKKGERGIVAGNVSAKNVKTNTMTLSYDVEFAANVK
jgi:hypothetical protein